MTQDLTKNPALKTQTKSAGPVDNSTKPQENKSPETFYHRDSDNAESNSVIVVPQKGAQLIPTGRKDANGNDTFKRGAFDYRYGLYTEFDADGNAVHPSNLVYEKGMKLEGVHIRYDHPVCDDEGNPLVDEQGRQYLFWAW
jgi:hypothetical protein